MAVYYMAPLAPLGGEYDGMLSAAPTMRAEATITVTTFFKILYNLSYIFYLLIHFSYIINISHKIHKCMQQCSITDYKCVLTEHVRNYTVSQKRIPDIFSYNSSKNCLIFIIL